MIPADLFRRGETLTADKLNGIVPYVLSRIFAGPGIQILPTGGGICIGAPQKPQRGIKLNDGFGFMMGKFASHNTDGNKLNVYLWKNDEWAASTTEVYMPYEFRAAYYNGKTITYADTRAVTYTKHSAYRRLAEWTDGVAQSEYQEITMPYAVDAPLILAYDGFGVLVDINWAGRHWAVAT